VKANLEITTLDLSFRRRALVGFTVGLVLYVVVVVALYPSFKNSSELDSLTKDSPGVAALFGISGSLTSPSGWMNANVWANFFPLVILLLTIGYGASAIAGQEKDGHLELVLSLPFSRRRVVAQKMGALSLQALVLCFFTFLAVLIGRWFELDFGIWQLITATVGVLLLGIDFGLLALAIGAGTGNRGVALGVTSTVAAASYLVSSMAPVVSWLDPAKYLSLFYWSVGDNQLQDGLSVAGAAVLVGVGLVLAVVADRLFQSHDLVA
jgi:beta-exotoxin I transport system permease protein